MKKLVLLAAVVLATAFTSIANDQSLIGKAHSIKPVNEAITDARQDGWDVNSSATQEGDLTRVTFYGQPNCAPGMYCIMVVREIATVYFDAKGNVVSYTVSSSSTI